jgi:hypothetical protein
MVSISALNGGSPADLLTNQAVLDPRVHGHTSRAPQVGIEPASPQTQAFALPTTPQIPIDTGHASIEHGANTDSDLARSPGGDHPASQQASPAVLTQGAARRGRSAARHALSSPSDSE